MKKFDVLSLECPLFGPHFLEASAGTGKTFSIEHIFVRLVLEGIEPETILGVTFTRAATRELKARIRSNLEGALAKIMAYENAWPYLVPHFGSHESIRRLKDALATFDQAQVFTIHGFCYRMLKEFAFEAKLSAFSNPEEGAKIPETLRAAAYDFLEHAIDSSFLCSEQISSLFKEFESIEELIEALLELEETIPSLSFSEISAKCKAALHSWNLEEDKLRQDFEALRGNYKSAVKGDFEAQIQALVSLDIRCLLKEKGSLFDFLSSENQKVRAKEVPFLHYPGFFNWAEKEIAPLFQQEVFPLLKTAFSPIAEKVLEEEPHFNPDEILLQMQKAIDVPKFKAKVRQKYKAAIIDEFQDTDKVQWDIFQKLFIEEPLQALYLVGDPKQSIYRFRKADIYTYLGARLALGEENAYVLDTNYRSSKSLVSALNALFERPFLYLPKLKEILPFYPVKAGSLVESDFKDHLGAIHFIEAQGDNPFEGVFLPYTAAEIERLKLNTCAILVKDRYQATKALQFLKKRGIAAAIKSQQTLGETESFQAIQELFAAVFAPHDLNAQAIVMAGPFKRADLYFPELKTLLVEKGLVPFAKEFSLQGDALQIFELLFAWEKENGFSFEGLKRYLKELKSLKSEEEGRVRLRVSEDAVQIMTMHVSKGLEFDVVFALGLAARTPGSENPEELDAEKMRQLYVAMTRAKKRLYVPVASATKIAPSGAKSPIELFSQYFEGPFLEKIEALSQKESITLERLSSPIVLKEPVKIADERHTEKTPLKLLAFKPSILASFTTLAKPKISEPKQVSDPTILPLGKETGVILHSLFEKLFGSKKRILGDLKAIEALVEEHLRFSPLENWQKEISEMVQKTLLLPLQSEGECFCLNEIEHFLVEVEFIFSTQPDFIKGFIDLIFFRNGKVYFIDWKTNWLENYESESLKKEADAHDYPFQARLYSEAIRRHFKKEVGGSFYIFVRGGAYLNLEVAF
jgi:exodeoxyribonuclease V beta subunit